SGAVFEDESGNPVYEEVFEEDVVVEALEDSRSTEFAPNEIIRVEEEEESTSTGSSGRALRLFAVREALGIRDLITAVDCLVTSSDFYMSETRMSAVHLAELLKQVSEATLLLRSVTEKVKNLRDMRPLQMIYAKNTRRRKQL
ncbi:unnamed protein product, partial [Gongylonema pulchrum]|uniref:Biogenesis of lysosome-related organelles complex 1 subunit 3 n=1 Tax=Gongylonema pulchrum TaxID=637853 RepID=A0A183DFV4_9BILA